MCMYVFGSELHGEERGGGGDVDKRITRLLFLSEPQLML